MRAEIGMLKGMEFNVHSLFVSSQLSSETLLLWVQCFQWHCILEIRSKYSEDLVMSGFGWEVAGRGARNQVY
jgi:hypothetical protein